jgi:alpha-amylase
MATFIRALTLLPVVLAFSVTSALAQTTRVEQGDPSISYSGNWYSNAGALNSHGVAALTNTLGARASIAFMGTGITWIGVLDGWSGLANVYLDGRIQVVDTYGPTTRYQQRLYTVAGLPSGPHTLSIEVLHERGSQTSGSWIWIDAFDIENGAGVPGGFTATANHVEESDPALLLAGKWFSISGTGYSGGAAVLAMDHGASMSIGFLGTGISWVAYQDEWSGMARVYVDGELKTTIDNYLSPSRARVTPYSIDNLPTGTHTLTIEVTGTRNASSKGAWVWVDAFDIFK